MRILNGCEYSGIVRDAFIDAGHDARSCDLLPSMSDKGFHYEEDLIHLICRIGHGFDLFIAHPPCTYLSSSGLHWNGRIPGRAEKTEEALLFVKALMAAPIDRICIENPDGCIGTRLKPEERGFIRQRIQPYMFGEDASKWTVLWLKDLEPLDIPPKDQWHPGRWVEWPKGSGKMVQRWSNQTDSGQNRLGPSETRGLDRAKTYPAIARAMVAKWGLVDESFRLVA